MYTLYTRWQSKMVAQAMQTRRVSLLAGARQCGKTTLARALQTPDTIYRTLDDVALLAAALVNSTHRLVTICGRRHLACCGSE